jgi:hypothetical protein
MLHFLYDLTHKLADCPNGFPDKASYVPLTELAALNAKKRQLKMNKPTPTAVVVPTAIIMPSAMLGDGSDSEYIVAPFYTPHFFLDVLISSSTASYQNTVHALIDHGSDSVLIDSHTCRSSGTHAEEIAQTKGSDYGYRRRGENIFFQQMGSHYYYFFRSSMDLALLSRYFGTQPLRSNSVGWTFSFFQWICNRS